MCFCDGLDYLVRNNTTSKQYYIGGDEQLTAFFDGYYLLPYLLQQQIEKKEVHHNDNDYIISMNIHPECEQVRWNLIRRKESNALYLRNGFIKTCPNKYRHLLPKEHQTKCFVKNI